MANVILRRPWELPERTATPESAWLDRRRFLGALGIGAAGLVAAGRAGRLLAAGAPPAPYPAPRNAHYTLDRPLTEEAVAARYNNFYEFTEDKEKVKDLVGKFRTHPWQVEVTGLVEKPRTWDVDELVRAMPLEERLYRHRCVEAWAMAVPWTGFPFRALLAAARPRSEARFVRLVSFKRPAEAPNQSGERAIYYAWPYFEALTLAEAQNELALLAIGIYGHPLPKQHGAPLRLVVPWKYGFKSIKSITRIELTDRQPPTFWQTLAPDEYHFEANVDPRVPHPRWSQASERMIGTDERRPTLPYNGYGEWVAKLYG
jgi:methionine sulfoxide reductase catalytic subunit